MIKYLVRDYWNRTGSFNGIEKNASISQQIDASDLLSKCYEYLGMSANDLADEKKSLLREKVFNQYVGLPEQTKMAILTLLKHCLTSPLCITNAGVPIFLFFYRDKNASKVNKVELRKQFKSAITSVSIKKSDNTFIIGNTMYCKDDVDAEVLLSVTQKLLQIIYSTVASCCSAPIELFSIVTKDRYYSKLVVLTETLGLTIEQFFDLFNFSLPDQTWSMREFGCFIYMLTPDLYAVIDSNGCEFCDEMAIEQRALSSFSSKVKKASSF